MSQNEVGLGDVVSFQWKDGYDTATVCEVHKNGTVDVFRPYTHVNDFSCAGRYEGSSSVYCYVGIETIREIHPKRLKVIRKGMPLLESFNPSNSESGE